MKCQNCGKNEATFYYRSSINGRVMESHLCPEFLASFMLVVRVLRATVREASWFRTFLCPPFFSRRCR